jgi:prevent-host-death family protein
LKRKLSAVDARKRLGEILEGVYYRGDEVVIERAGKPMAVVISADLYESLERNRDRFFELIEKNWQENKALSFEEIEQEIAGAVRQARVAAREDLPASSQ